MKGIKFTNIMPPDEEELKGPHRIIFNSGFPVCDRCGHIPLNNRIGELVDRLGCGYRKSAQFKAWIENGKRF